MKLTFAIGRLKCQFLSRIITLLVYWNVIINKYVPVSFSHVVCITLLYYNIKNLSHFEIHRMKCNVCIIP